MYVVTDPVYRRASIYVLFWRGNLSFPPFLYVQYLLGHTVEKTRLVSARSSPEDDFLPRTR